MVPTAGNDPAQPEGLCFTDSSASLAEYVGVKVSRRVDLNHLIRRFLSPPPRSGCVVRDLPTVLRFM